jgi:hypothetical protein
VEKSIRVVDPESREKTSDDLGIPGLREMTEKEIMGQEIYQRAKTIEEIKRGLAEIHRFSIIQAKLLAGAGLNDEDVEFLTV